MLQKKYGYLVLSGSSPKHPFSAAWAAWSQSNVKVTIPEIKLNLNLLKAPMTDSCGEWLTIQVNRISHGKLTYIEIPTGKKDKIKCGYVVRYVAVVSMSNVIVNLYDQM